MSEVQHTISSYSEKQKSSETDRKRKKNLTNQSKEERILIANEISVNAFALYYGLLLALYRSDK